MKKLVIILVLCGFFVSTATPAFAGHYGYHSSYRHRGFSGRHVYRHDGFPAWGFLGLGILTGSIVTNLIYGPPAEAVVVRPAQPVFIQRAPVVVQTPPPVILPPATVESHISVTTQILNVRSGPGMNFPIIGVVYQNDILTIKGSAPEWLYTQLPSGTFGWVMAEFTSQTSPSPNG